MRVAIVGAGIGGSYLYAILKRQYPNYKVDVYSIRQHTNCGARPCGWLVNYSMFIAAGSRLGLNFSRFVLRRYQQMAIDGKQFPADVAVINKPLLINTLLSSAYVCYDPPDIFEYDRVVDATAVRAYLPTPSNYMFANVRQVRCDDPQRLCPEGIFEHEYGYGYIIPVGDGTSHIGYASLGSTVNVNEEVKYLSGSKKIVCSCSASFWCGGPIQPFSSGNTVGIGESIGLVEPLSGVGILPAMDSAWALFQYWNNTTMYELIILQKYKFMTDRAKILAQRPVLLKFANFALSNDSACKLMGFKVSAAVLVKLLESTSKYRSELSSAPYFGRRR